MSEEEEFRAMEQLQIEERILKLAEVEADKFVANSRYSLDILTLHQAYKRGYANALLDLVIRGKELL
jgi:hypothetical protein